MARAPKIGGVTTNVEQIHTVDFIAIGADAKRMARTPLIHIGEPLTSSRRRYRPITRLKKGL